jgi:hypothetical protein
MAVREKGWKRVDNIPALWWQYADMTKYPLNPLGAHINNNTAFII